MSSLSSGRCTRSCSRPPSEQGVSPFGGDVYTLKRRPQRVQLRRPVRRRNRIAGSTFISTTASIGCPSASSIVASAFAWAMLRGNPSRMNPCSASGRLSRSRMSASTRSSDTSAPASIAAFACNPSGVRRATASRNRSPEEIWGAPYLPASRCDCVPLPDPGAPSNTILISSLLPRRPVVRSAVGARKAGTLPIASRCVKRKHPGDGRTR